MQALAECVATFLGHCIRLQFVEDNYNPDDPEMQNDIRNFSIWIIKELKGELQKNKNFYTLVNFKNNPHAIFNAINWKVELEYSLLLDHLPKILIIIIAPESILVSFTFKEPMVEIFNSKHNITWAPHNTFNKCKNSAITTSTQNLYINWIVKLQKSRRFGVASVKKTPRSHP